jgi:hypothetical protein
MSMLVQTSSARRSISLRTIKIKRLHLWLYIAAQMFYKRNHHGRRRGRRDDASASNDGRCAGGLPKRPATFSEEYLGRGSWESNAGHCRLSINGINRQNPTFVGSGLLIRVVQDSTGQTRARPVYNVSVARLHRPWVIRSVSQTLSLIRY